MSRGRGAVLLPQSLPRSVARRTAVHRVRLASEGGACRSANTATPGAAAASASSRDAASCPSASTTARGLGRASRHRARKRARSGRRGRSGDRTHDRAPAARADQPGPIPRLPRWPHQARRGAADSVRDGDVLVLRGRRDRDRCGARPGSARRRSGSRQRQREGASLADLALDRDIAAHGPGEVAADREPEAGAFVRAGE